jgi:hypothetical protein
MPFEEMVRIHVGLLSVMVVKVRVGRRSKTKACRRCATPAAESVAQCILRARALAGKDRRQARVSPAETKEMH